MSSSQPPPTHAVPIPTAFPALVPSYTFSFRIGGPTSPVGAFTRGQPLTVVSIVRGIVRTEAPAPSASPAVQQGAGGGAGGGTGGSGGGDGGGDGQAGTGTGAGAAATRQDGVVRLEATVRGQGVDYVRNDPDGGRMRLDAGVVVEDDEGNLVCIKYTGIVDIDEQLTAILAGRSDARSTAFGHSFINVTFETGCERYKDLERNLFVGAGRFIVDAQGLGVEYKVSRVSWRPP